MLSLQAAHEGGLIGLVELSSVSRKQFLDGAGVGVTVGGGYRFGAMVEAIVQSPQFLTKRGRDVIAQEDKR